MESSIAFIGGGHMAAAILRGLIRGGCAPAGLLVVEPLAAQRERLVAELGVSCLDPGDSSLARAAAVVWAVKPQSFAAAARDCAAHVRQALQISVMAGVRSDAIAEACGGSRRVVRAMPNTPALIGEGIAGVFAGPEVQASDRETAAQVLGPTGTLLWVDREADLDAVTALSGSGPAYFFYLIEAMVAAGVRMGLGEPQARELALVTCRGAAAQALASGEAPARLREKVTSKGGTTEAALAVLEQAGVGDAMQRAVLAAQQRARELGDEIGR